MSDTEQEPDVPMSRSSGQTSSGQTSPPPNHLLTEDVPRWVSSCDGSTYVSVGRAEPDDPLQQIAECNGPVDCGWSVVMQEWSDPAPDGEWDVAVTSESFLPLHAAHLAHREGKRDV